jgi:hypothetical protein
MFDTPSQLYSFSANFDWHHLTLLDLYVQLSVKTFVFTGFFTSDNEPGGIENATHNTFPTLTWLF